MAPEPLRVGLDARMLYHTGIGRYIRNLVPALAETGEVALTVWVPPAAMGEPRLAHPRISLRPCPFPVFSPSIPFWWLHEIPRARLDLFHAPHFEHPFFNRIPLVLTLHDLIPLVFPETVGNLQTWLFDACARWGVHKARRIIAVSENTRRDLVRLVHADDRQIRVVLEGADQPLAAPLPKEAVARILDRLGIRSPYLLYTSQWKPYKNLRTLLDALAILHDEGFEPMPRLVLTGTPRLRDEPMLQRIDGLGLRDHVVVTGYLKDEHELAALYQGATLFVFPSRYEGFGLPPLEAMAAGLPVLCSNAASLPEVCGDAAVMLDPMDVTQWAQAIRQTLTSYPARERLIEAGYRQVRRFSWEKAANETVAVYREAISPGRSPAG